MSSKMLCSFLLSISASISLAAVNLEDLTLEEKVGQTLMANFTGTLANEQARILIEDIHVGGIIYYNWANELKCPSQVQKLSKQLQELSQATPPHIPLFIAVDQEGGRVNRLKEGFTIFPSNEALAKNEDLAQSCAFASGEELRAVGINMNLAPVVDVNADLGRPVMGNRSFGSNPQEVAKLGKHMLAGYQKSGIIACLKHFPGMGDTEVDPHGALPMIHKTTLQMEQRGFFPFKALLPLADVIMTAHVMIPELDPIHPATLSPLILEGILRNSWNYEGVILSDSLVMQALLENGASIQEIAIQAFNAGCDILCLGGKDLLGVASGLELRVDDLRSIHQTLVEAVRSQRISEKRLNQAVERILKLKSSYDLSSCSSLSEKDIEEKVFTQGHQDLSNKAALDPLQTSINQLEILP